MATENIDIRVSEDGSRVVRRRLDDIADGAERAQNSVDKMNSLLAMVGKYLVVSEVMKWADAWSVAASSIKIATKNSYEFVQVQTELFKIAQRSRQEFGALAELYAAVARQSENLKTSQKGLLLYTENIAKALAIQHTSMAAARGPLLQLGQAMASGTIRAQEFNSIMLGLPYVMKIVAENFKGGSVSVMQLRQMMLQGKLESKEFFEAFQRGSAQINDDFNKTQVTFSQAFTIFKNELIKFTGTMDSTTGASAKFATVLKFVADNLVLLAASLLAVTVGVKLGPIIDNFIAMRAESAATAAAVTAANAQMAASEAATTAAAIAGARASVVKTEAELASARATQAAIIISREAALATLAKANSDIAAARASIQAATSAGALSYALAVKREAEIALTAAEVRRSASLSELAVLGQQQARVTVIQTEATAAHTAAVRALAVAQGLGAESAAAYALAQGGAAAATARVGVAAGAATVATRLFSGAVALMGGPIGVVITALIGLVLWLGNVVSKANAAKEALEAVNRVDAAKTGGAGVRQSDAEKIQAAQSRAQKDLEDAQDRLATLNKNIAKRRAAGYGESADQLEKQFGAGMQRDIDEAAARVSKFANAMEDAKKYSAETGGAAGLAARELSQARGAWEASIGSVKTASTVQEKYSQELDKSRDAHKAYLEQLTKSNEGGVNNDEIQKAIATQAEVEKQMEKNRDAALKSLSNKGAAVKQQIQLEADERLSINQAALENELSVRKSAYESEKRLLDTKHQNGLLSEAQFMAQNLQMVQRYDDEERAIIARRSEIQRVAYGERRAYILKTLDGQAEKNALVQLDAEYAKFVDSTNAKLAKLETSAFERQTSAIYKLNGELKKLIAQDERYWNQAEANMDKEEALVQSKKSMAYATEEQKAAYEAYTRVGEAHNAQLNRLSDAYEDARKEADDFSASIDWREAGTDTIAILEAMNGKADEFAQRLSDAYARLDILRNRAAAAAAEAVRNKDFERNVGQISDALETAIFEGGKAGGKKFTDWLKNYFLRNPIRILLQGVVSIAGQMLGMGGGMTGSGGMSLMNLASMGSNAYSLYSGGLANTAAGQFYAGYTGATVAPGVMGPSVTQTSMWSQGGNMVGGGGAGTGGIGALGSAAIFAAIALGIANAFGVFRTETKVGSGIRGTLGKGGSISPWEEWREGGTLFDGPSFETINPVEELERARKRLKELEAMEATGQLGNPQALYTQQSIVEKLEAEYGDLAERAAKQAKAIENAFDLMRTNVIDMAKVLGLSTDKLENFTTQLGGSDKGLNFEGMNSEQIQNLIMEALATANNDMAQQILGTWETTTRKVRRDTAVNTGAEGEDRSIEYSTEYEDITSTRYIPSEYAREGEKAIDTLTRLATSLSVVNQVFDTLGHSLFDASLAGGDLASKLVDLFGSIDAFVSATNAYYEAMYTEEERAVIAQRQMTEEFRKQGIAMPKTIDEYKKLVDAQDLTTEEGRKMYHFLIMLGPQFAALADKAKDAADAMAELESSTDAAFAALESSINREIAALEASKTAIQKTLSTATEIFNIFDSAFVQLMSTIESATAMSYTEGRAYLENAAANPSARLDPDEAKRAIAGINGGLGTDNFGSKLDYDRERLTIAGQYEKIRDAAKQQMTIDEQILDGINTEIARLNDLLKLAKQQLDAMRGNEAATLSVEEAILQFHAAWAAENIARDPGNGSPGTGGGAGSGGAVFGPGTPAQQANAKYKQVTSLGSAGVGYIPITDTDYISKLDGLYDIYHSFDGTGNLTGLLEAVQAAGGTMDDLSALSGYYANDWRAAGAAVGIPAFANGGDHYGGLRWVGERGIELEATGASRIWNQSQMGRALALGVSAMDEDDSGDYDGMATVQSELSSLRISSYKMNRESMLSLKKIEQLMSKNDKLGMPPTRTEEETV